MTNLQYSRLSDIYGRKLLLLSSYIIFGIGVGIWWDLSETYTKGAPWLTTRKLYKQPLLDPRDCSGNCRTRCGRHELFGLDNLKWYNAASSQSNLTD